MLGRLILLAAAVLLVFPNALKARVGELRADCEQRYGKGRDIELKVASGLQEEAENWKAAIYYSHGLVIEIIYQDDRAVLVRYSNQPVLSLGDQTRAPHSLTQSEIEFLRSANVGEKVKWRRHQESVLEEFAPTVTVWKTPDDLYFAGYDREDKRLFVCSERFWNTIVGHIRDNAAAKDRDDTAKRFGGL